MLIKSWPFVEMMKSATSFNRGNYVELIYAFAENDERISRHLETSTVFSGLSNRIQNDIIEAVAEVIRTDIRKDINKASFVAVEVDETTDVTQKAQISVIFRYVCEASYIAKEAFLGFDDVSFDRRASAKLNMSWEYYKSSTVWKSW